MKTDCPNPIRVHLLRAPVSPWRTCIWLRLTHSPPPHRRPTFRAGPGCIASEVIAARGTKPIVCPTCSPDFPSALDHPYRREQRENQDQDPKYDKADGRTQRSDFHCLASREFPSGWVFDNVNGPRKSGFSCNPDKRDQRHDVQQAGGRGCNGEQASPHRKLSYQLGTAPRTFCGHRRSVSRDHALSLEERVRDRALGRAKIRQRVRR
jgi:hypothetical protein